MAQDMDRIESNILALRKTLDTLDASFRDATIDATYYFKRRQALVRDLELANRELKQIFADHDAPEMAAVLDKATAASGTEDDEAVQAEMDKAMEAGAKKGWGATLTEAVSEQRGSIVKTAIAASLKVARGLLGLP